MENSIGNTIAFIPLRGGSKSIPLKNIKILAGRPLVFWVLDATVNCDNIDKVVVSTDSEEIKSIVDSYGSDKIMVIDRSKGVSSDTASTESTMIEFARDYIFENIVLVQATSPLLKSCDLKKGFEKYNTVGVDSVLSGVRQKRFVWEEFNSFVRPINYDPLNRPRRQDFDGYCIENGAFYITSREQLLTTNCRISGNIGMIEMSEETYFEIDEPNDWLIVENILNRNNKVDKFHQKIMKIKCLLTDCDGVMTDGGMYYSENGDELKRFNTRDGMGFQLLRENGFFTGMITGENSLTAKKRAAKLKLDIIYTDIKDKRLVIDEICNQFSLRPDEIAYIGDDINDMDVIRTVGFGCAVYDANDRVKKVADYITTTKGGEGAVREVIDMILFEQLGVQNEIG